MAFGATSPTTFKAHVASSTSGGTIEIRFDSQSGTLIGSRPVAGAGGYHTFSKPCPVCYASPLL